MIGTLSLRLAFHTTPTGALTMRYFLTTLLAALTLALSGCGYNTFQTTDEQIKAS